VVARSRLSVARIRAARVPPPAAIARQRRRPRDLNSRKFLWVEIEEKSLENLGTLGFHEIWPTSSWLHLARKNQFPSKEDQKVEFHSKREIWLIS
jgi:hypothetical protein